MTTDGHDIRDVVHSHDNDLLHAVPGPSLFLSQPYADISGQSGTRTQASSPPSSAPPTPRDVNGLHFKHSSTNSSVSAITDSGNRSTNPFSSVADALDRLDYVPSSVRSFSGLNIGGGYPFPEQQISTGQFLMHLRS